MVINREKYYRWSWLIDLFNKKDLLLGGLSDNREKLYAVAYSFLGKDASPKDHAPDDLACAESVNAVVKAAFGFEVGGDLSTTKMYSALTNSKEFQETDTPLFGDIIISPTGSTRTPVGHVGIVGKWQIMSNNSYTGLWDAHYTLESWRLRYGFVAYYRCVEVPPPAEIPPAVKEIVESTAAVAKEAVKYPVLIAPLMALLSALGNFLNNLKLNK
jgi:hypothetical protein